MARTLKDVTPKHRVKRTLETIRLLRGFDRAAPLRGRRNTRRLAWGVGHPP